MGTNGLVTAVVGAGPVGLLFCITGRIMFEGQGGDAATWPILLFDKRLVYQRSHRLRIAADPILKLQHELKDPRFDAVIDFLGDCRFSPAINQLEERLSALASELGIDKEHLEVGSGPEMVPLLSLRSHLENQDRISRDAQLTIVGADSVHSTVRETVRGGYRSIERTHQTVARLKIVGPDLPQRLGRIDQYRISKVLGSIVDYRLNPNGFAEVDVFLSGSLHQRLRDLGATPASSVELTKEVMTSMKAPLFERLVEHFRHDLVSAPTQVLLHSTFRLEHRYVNRVTYEDPARNTQICLVGDAAVSLPFFRGMACHVRSVHSLARAHCELARSPKLVLESGRRRGDKELLTPLARYERESGAIRTSEIATVNARARLVRGAKEFARVSSLLPFPLQSWFLSIPDRHRPQGRMSAGVFINVLVALAACAFAIGGFIVDPTFVWIAVPIQIGGGLAYRAGQEFEPGPDTLLRRVWLLQIVILFMLGSALTVESSLAAGRISDPFAALLWLILGYIFVIGMLIYDALGRRWLRMAQLDADEL